MLCKIRKKYILHGFDNKMIKTIKISKKHLFLVKNSVVIKVVMNVKNAEKEDDPN